MWKETYNIIIPPTLLNPYLNVLGVICSLFKAISTPGIYSGSLEDPCGSQIAAVLPSSLCCSLAECDGLLGTPGKVHFSPGRATCWHLSGSPICQDTWASLSCPPAAWQAWKNLSETFSPVTLLFLRAVSAARRDEQEWGLLGIPFQVINK